MRVGCAVVTAETGTKPGPSTSSAALRVLSLPPSPAVEFPPKVDVLVKQTLSPESFIQFDLSGKDQDGCRGTLSLALGLSRPRAHQESWPVSCRKEGGGCCLELRKMMWLGKAEGERAEKGRWGSRCCSRNRTQTGTET